MRGRPLALARRTDSAMQQCPPAQRLLRRAAAAAAFATSTLLWACTTAPVQAPPLTVTMPLLSGWFQGQAVFYVTTDVSDAKVALAKSANYAPRLADALPGSPRQPGQASSVDKVYAVLNFTQGSVFASAPAPMGAKNQDRNYSPLWQQVNVTWRTGRTPRVLKSEEDVLAAAEQGTVELAATRVVLNCPIVHRGPLGGLPGVAVGNLPP